ncbi:uncharacterized protein LOC117592586 [Drosophila guanche]|uniref:Uncharacterized protein n=1 Tax=Drosophila guanche TaxID=7266 RepID=A0A3B0JHM5_DROGU|nr:uncharacterized protein LOC117592586 [Drosophila guanche]SPP74890.1 Hypothetical predicted protein [Drosophila guanche]
MILIRGQYETAQLGAAIIVYVIMFLCGCNVVTFHYVPDLPTVLFLYTLVLLSHHLRVLFLRPVQNTWQFLLELAGAYFISQLAILIIWESFYAVLDLCRMSLESTVFFQKIFHISPTLFFHLRHDPIYLLKLMVAVYSAIKMTVLTKANEYAMACCRTMSYYEEEDMQIVRNAATMKNVNPNRTRATSRAKPRSRKATPAYRRQRSQSRRR